MAGNFQRNKLSIWDLGGTLNELDPASECPPNDVISINNWRVHQDGHSREKRPGYTKLDTGYSAINQPIRGVFEYEDINNNQHVVIVGSNRVQHRENVYTWTQQYLDTDGDYSLGWRSPFLFNGKLSIVDHGPDVGKLQILQSSDGSTFTQLAEDSSPINISASAACSVVEFNGEIMIASYGLTSGNPMLTRYDGAWNDELSAPWNGSYGCHIHRWDGKAWILIYRTEDWKVYHYNGTSYSGIANYDGAATIVTNSTQRLHGSIRPRGGRFFTWNNKLYLVASIKSGGKWRWQLWRFNDTLYDRFTKIYEHSTDDDYGVCAVVEWNNKMWIISQKLDYVGDAGPDGDSNKVYSSDGDLTSWTKECDTGAIGWVMGEEVFDGKLFVSTIYNFGVNDHTHIAYWDDDLKNFVSEATITTDVPPGEESTGDLITFGGELYLFKYREVYKRELSTNQYSDLQSWSDEYDEPIAGAYWHHRLYIARDGLLALEGDDTFYLGINAPTTAPTVAAGAAGSLAGDYQAVVTFYRSGNYPCESNPSPESATVTLASQQISLTNIPTSADPKVNARRIYLTTAGGAKFYWVTDILDNSTTSLSIDTDDDTILGGDEVSYDRHPPPAGKYLEVWDNRLWVGGVEDYPYMVMYTNAGTSEEMASTNFLQFRVPRSETMMQIKAFGDRLFVFFETKIFRIDKIGASMYDIEELPQNIGCAASWSVAVCDKFMCWLSEFGIEVFNGNECFRPIVSRYVKTTLSTLNRNFIQRVAGGHHFDNGEYWLAIPTGSNEEPDKVIVFRYLEKSFTVYAFPAGLTYLTSISLRQEGLVFLTGTDDGYVYIQDSGYDDDGAPISSYFWTPWYYVAKERELHNILRRMFIKYVCPASHSITMDVYANFDKTSILTKVLTGSTPTDNIELRKEILARVNLRIPGVYISFKFTQNTATGGEVKIEGWDIYFNSELWRYSMTGD